MVEHSLEEVSDVIHNSIKYSLTRAPPAFLQNARRLLDHYSGDPRNTIKGKTVDQARESLMQFKGIKTGIANLYMIFMQDRNIVLPSDPENVRPKIDIHKARISLMNDGLKIQSDKVRRDVVVDATERAYRDASRKIDVTTSEIDRTLWIIGSEICVKKSYSACVRNCPLSSICKGYISEDPKTAELQVYENGERIDLRKSKGQGHFDFAKA